jgi:predicted DNA-binding WGR domain protein
MKRTFIYTDDKSNKFWTIETAETAFTVTFGKVGTAGQTSEKSFADAAACTKEVNKLIAEKTKKGYAEQAPAKTNKEVFEEIQNAPSLAEGLTTHFAYLADTPGFEPVLQAIMSLAQGVRLEDDQLIVEFPEGNQLSCSEPAVVAVYAAYPYSFKQAVSVHEYISFPDDGGWA